MKSKLRRFALPTLAFIVLCVVTLDFTSKSLTPMRDEITATESQTDALRKQTAQGRAAQQDISRIDAANAAAIGKIPDEARLAEVIEQVDALARGNRLAWTAGAPAPTPVADVAIPAGVYAWTMSASFTGPLNSIYRLLDGLDGLDRVVSVQTINLQDAGNDYVASVVLRFYALGA